MTPSSTGINQSFLITRIQNVCRTWTYETGVALGLELDENMPYNEYIEYFGPRFKLEVPCSNMDDQNSREYIENIK